MQIVIKLRSHTPHHGQLKSGHPREIVVFVVITFRAIIRDKKPIDE